MGWIYKITNIINGKMYIGKTESIDPYQRWKEHTTQYVTRKFEKRPLYSAMSKYGVDNFNFEVIEEAEDGDYLCEREKYYISYFRTYVGFDDCNGYNLTLGGDGRPYINLDENEVIKYYNSHNMSVTQAEKHFHVSFGTIAKILDKNHIKRMPPKTSDEYYVHMYGGIVMMDYNGYTIIDIMDSPRQFHEKYNFDVAGIKKAISKESGYKSGRAQHYLWYRLNELPKEYKPLLEKYYQDKQLES